MSALEIPQRHRMVESAMDALLSWRHESTAATHADRRWTDARGAEAQDVWRAYQAAGAAEQSASLLHLESAQQADGGGAALRGGACVAACASLAGGAR